VEMSCGGKFERATNWKSLNRRETMTVPSTGYKSTMVSNG